MLRYALSVAFASRAPLPTLVINVIGSLMIGILAAATGPQGHYPLPASMRALLIPGLCGGFTTFSTFSMDALMLWESSPAKAALYVGASVIFSLSAVWAGATLASRR